MWSLKRWILNVQQEKWWILITVGNTKGVYERKYCYASVKKSIFSKMKNLKEDPRRKTDSNFDFSHAA